MSLLFFLQFVSNSYTVKKISFLFDKKIQKLTDYLSFTFDNFFNLDSYEDIKKLPIKDNITCKDEDKSEAVNDTKNDSLNKDENENINGVKNKNKNENKDENEIKNESENGNILFLRFLTASLCEVLISKYGHDILNGKTSSNDFVIP